MERTCISVWDKHARKSHNGQKYKSQVSDQIVTTAQTFVVIMMMIVAGCRPRWGWCLQSPAVYFPLPLPLFAIANASQWTKDSQARLCVFMSSQRFGGFEKCRNQK